MARDRANIRIDMLGDSDYRDLSGPAQLLYHHLLIHPSLSYAGVADWRPGRLAKMTAGVTARQILEAAEELQRGHFIYADEESEEVLVRSFVRHDGLLKRVRMGVAMAKAYAEISSPEIRRYFAWELKRLHDESPELDCWSDKRVSGILKEPMEDMKSIGHAITQPLPDPSETASVDPSVDPFAMTYPTPSVDPPPTTTTATATATPTDVGGSGGKRSPERPLPADWSPNDTHRAYARENGINLDFQAERFKTWALAKDVRYRRWDQGFKNWLLKAERSPAQEHSVWNM